MYLSSGERLILIGAVVLKSGQHTSARHRCAGEAYDTRSGYFSSAWRTRPVPLARTHPGTWIPRRRVAWANPPDRRPPVSSVNCVYVGSRPLAAGVLRARGYRIDVLSLGSPTANMYQAQRKTLVHGTSWEIENHAQERVPQLYGGYLVPGSASMPAPCRQPVEHHNELTVPGHAVPRQRHLLNREAPDHVWPAEAACLPGSASRIQCAELVHRRPPDRPDAARIWRIQDAGPAAVDVAAV